MCQLSEHDHYMGKKSILSETTIKAYSLSNNRILEKFLAGNRALVILVASLLL
jgi:hypothetical protein